ncbi:zf-HC2 domain-containing protein [Pelotomaculum terephthalicicum JT]|uniref:anti-sigma factor family protein n=1 Tax=Pelotomaculum terephthalicicum TaxID=206393 RepID=UPI001F04C8D5|nr:zf-HC2 domain-containing protein [Pelotomaculum terephthalicicum]MCG9967305.1 zf-HC2 domain-containing protein [Pelotomaculum terephthalicicum JT]
MNCRKTKKALSKYLAGELRSSETAAIEKHLAGCPACAAELKELQRLDRLLDLWRPEPAPDNFWADVMAEAAQSAFPQPAGTRSVNRQRYSLPTFFKQPEMSLLRDLLTAAAVSLAIFWGAGGWFDGRQMADYGNSINSVTSAYTGTVDKFLERTTGAAGKYTRPTILEELKQR